MQALIIKGSMLVYDGFLYDVFFVMGLLSALLFCTISSKGISDGSSDSAPSIEGHTIYACPPSETSFCIKAFIL